jgi:DNA-binding MarR family transcriptional regulator
MGEQDETDVNKMLYFLPSKLKKAVSKIAADFITETSLKEYYFPVLQAIYYKDGITQKEITAYLPFDKSRISVVVNELIDNGFVTDSGEGRSSCLHLTEEGKNANAAARMYNTIVFDKMFEGFTQEELDEAVRFFSKLDRRLDDLIAEKDSHDS